MKRMLIKFILFHFMERNGQKKCNAILFIANTNRQSELHLVCGTKNWLTIARLDITL